MSFSANLSNISKLTSYFHTKGDINWINAIKNELDALEASGTWKLTNLSSGKRAIGLKWVYKMKLKPHATTDRYKVHFVAEGYHQIMRNFLTIFPRWQNTVRFFLISLLVNHVLFIN